MQGMGRLHGQRWTVVLAVILIAVLGLGGAPWYSGVRKETAASEALSVRQALAEMSQIVFFLARAEAAQQAYRLYGDRAYIQGADESLLAASRSMKSAERMLNIPGLEDDWHQLGDMIALRAAASRRNDKVQGVIRFVAASNEFNPGVPGLDRMHRVLNRLMAAGNGRLQELETECIWLRRMRHASLSLMVAVLAASLFLLPPFRRRPVYCGVERRRVARAPRHVGVFDRLAAGLGRVSFSRFVTRGTSGRTGT